MYKHALKASGGAGYCASLGWLRRAGYRVLRNMECQRAVVVLFLFLGPVEMQVLGVCCVAVAENLYLPAYFRSPSFGEMLHLSVQVSVSQELGETTATRA